MIDEGLEMRQEKRQSSTIRKRIRRLYRQMRFKFWLAEQDYRITYTTMSEYMRGLLHPATSGKVRKKAGEKNRRSLRRSIA